MRHRLLETRLLETRLLETRLCESRVMNNTLPTNASISPFVHLSAIACLALVGCAGSPLDAEKPPAEEDVPVDGAFDSFRSPIDHGALMFGRPERSELTAAQGFHAWTFELTGPASVTVLTQRATPRSREVDTVLYLYRESATGWGRALTSNDDSMGTLFSAISRDLTAGRYRVLVKGYVRATRGGFGVLADCTGVGCAAIPAPAPACLFGDNFGALGESLRLLSNPSTYTMPDMPPVQAAQLVRAMNVSGHPEVTTAAQVFPLVTDGVVERIGIYDGPGARAFTAWRFVLGDHYFGAIFPDDRTELVAKIVDNANTECSVGFELCLVGASYRAFRDGTLRVVSNRVLTSATGLSAARQAQLVRAVQEAYSEVRTAAEAIARVDSSTVNEIVRTDAASGKTFVAYEYGAGDNSYGAIFEGNSATPAGRINDGDVYGCNVFGPAPAPALAGGDCSRAAQCAEELRCIGVDPDEEIGRCVSTAEIPGNEASCSASAACMPGLVCSGVTRGPEGICRPAWMRGTYRSATQVTIPDASTTGAYSGVRVYGIATVDTDVEVTARITHARSTDLRITLVNVAGTEQLVYDGATATRPLTSPFEITQVVSGSGDESVTGVWNLRVVDSRRGTTGTLDSWSLTVTSRWD